MSQFHYDVEKYRELDIVAFGRCDVWAAAQTSQRPKAN
jgi:hypothetical protein